jgi:hypothetical protein
MFASGDHVAKRVGELEDQSRDTRMKLTIHGGADVSPPALSGESYRVSPGNGIARMDSMRYLKRRRGSYYLLTTGMRYRCVCVCECRWNM